MGGVRVPGGQRWERWWSFPWPHDEIAGYTAYRVAEAPTIDGRLDEPAWRRAPRSPRFRDLVSGAPTRYDTRAAVLWDDQRLYVGYWVEEPNVTATLTERDSPVYTDNDIELFVAGRDAYYELEVNAHGTIYEALFVWDDAYPESGGYGHDPGLAPDAPGLRPFDGVGFVHPARRPSGVLRLGPARTLRRRLRRWHVERPVRHRPRLDGRTGSAVGRVGADRRGGRSITAAAAR